MILPDVSVLIHAFRTDSENHAQHEACLESIIIGNLIQDTWFAALAIEAGCEWDPRLAPTARSVRLDRLDRSRPVDAVHALSAQFATMGSR